MKRWIVWIIVVALAAALLYQCRRGEPIPLGRAIANNQLSVTAGSFDEQNDTVVVTVTRQPGTSGKILAALPVGTIIHNRDPDGQRLMTAAGVVVTLQPDETSKSVTVEVYCLDQFALRPTAQTGLALAFAETGEGDVIESAETEPVRKLDECLEGKEFSHKERQVAVWIVAGGYLDQDYSTVMERLFEAQRQISQAQADKHFSEFAQRTRQQLRNFPANRVEQRIDHYRTEVMPGQVEQHARDETEKLLVRFRDSRFTLSPCVENPGDKKFFQTVPASV